MILIAMACDPPGHATADVPMLRLSDNAVVQIHTFIDDPPF